MASAGKKTAREQERRERIEAQRRQREAAARRRRNLSIVAPIVVVIAIVAIVYGLSGHSTGLKQDTGSGQVLPLSVVGTTTTEKPVSTVPNTSGISGVVAYDTKGYPSSGKSDAGTLPHEHVLGPVVYSVTPPVGGDHNGTWMNCGVYTQPVPNERAVHNLEHGAIWITYRPSLSAAEVTALTNLVLKQSTISFDGVTSHFMTVSPWASDALPSPIVASAWGYQLQVTSASDPRLQQFITAFRHRDGGDARDGRPLQRPAGRRRWAAHRLLGLVAQNWGDRSHGSTTRSGFGNRVRPGLGRGMSRGRITASLWSRRDPTGCACRAY